MKRIYWILVLLCGTVAFATSVPPVDDPCTPYDEADAVVNVSLPSLEGMKLVPPAQQPGILPMLSLASKSDSSRSDNFVSELPAGSFHSSQQLLCTFLI